MKNKTIQEEYQDIINQIKSLGTVRIQEELDALESTFSKTSNLYARMGILGRIDMHKRAMKELEA
jgi:hypothetical protein